MGVKAMLGKSICAQRLDVHNFCNRRPLAGACSRKSSVSVAPLLSAEKSSWQMHISDCCMCIGRGCEGETGCGGALHDQLGRHARPIPGILSLCPDYRAEVGLAFTCTLKDQDLLFILVHIVVLDSMKHNLALLDLGNRYSVSAHT
jgi:hypothetical protein